MPGASGRRREFPETVHTGYGGAMWRAADHEGLFHLFVIDGEQRQTVDTQHGPSECVRAAHVVVWRDDGAPVRYSDVPVFGAYLTGQLSGHDYRWGELGKGAAERGKNAPWVILDPTDEQTDWLRGEWGGLWDESGGCTVALADPAAGGVGGPRESDEEPF